MSTGTRGLRGLGVVGLLGVLPIVIAACGGSSSTSGTTSASSTTASPPTSTTGGSTSTTGSASVIVSSAVVQHAGRVLVDAQGRTLYVLSSEAGGKVTCTQSNGCVAVWPPVTLPAGATAVAGADVDASKLSKASAPGATTYVTYAGYPLYTFSADKEPNEDNGVGVKSFGGTWAAITPSGKLVEHSGTTTATTAGSGGGGYKY